MWTVVELALLCRTDSSVLGDCWAEGGLFICRSNVKALGGLFGDSESFIAKSILGDLGATGVSGWLWGLWITYTWYVSVGRPLI